MRRFAGFVVIALAALPSLAAAQWKPIGKTKNDGGMMSVQSKSIRRGGDTVTALILRRFAAPQWDEQRKDTLRAVTTLVTINCKADKMAVREYTYYRDFDRGRVSSRRVVPKPGYGAIFGAAFPLVRDSLCAKAK